MAKESKVTKIRLELLGSDELDCEGRKAKPVITGHITGDELDSFVYDAPSSRDDQPAHAKFLGLLHAGRMPDLSFFLGYTAKKQRSEFVLGLDTSLKMLVGCDNLNLEVRVTMVGNTCKPGVEFVAALTHQHPLEFGTKKYKCNVWFIDDNTVFYRQIRATFILRQGQRRSSGVYMRGLVSGGSVSKDKDINYYKPSWMP
jgi:hypothetical protein